ncbi:MAG: bifunctional 3-demethylubiquinone-9 3-methyltransferase/ 2-octaprenyl-6-hydroxy phenol methylase [Planctomycetes bacterium ADurb.Bin412]|nr:MAG: bifunctional 3-demethylubiquinone-9 3-methyltransferase/ 2-octaprenyl-6-hydroxy phenol methylase [Planctomycetes bacterium ADurb.Bin412]
MCNDACMQFGITYLSREDIHGRKIIEVGALNVNGSLRSAMEGFGPSSYLGVDIAAGLGVDEICDINELTRRYGTERFDVVISTELMEHVRNWRGAIINLKQILKPGGILLLTTRSAPFHYHGYPYDFWRYEVEDIEVIFSDFNIETIEKDPLAPGVFLKAKKPAGWHENDLTKVALHSMVKGRRCRNIRGFDILYFRTKRSTRAFLSKILPTSIKTFLKKIFRRED